MTSDENLKRARLCALQASRCPVESPYAIGSAERRMWLYFRNLQYRYEAAAWQDGG